MDELKPFKIYNPSMDAQMAPFRYLIVLEEARVLGEKADDFVRRYPYGLDIQPLKVPPRKPILRLIPGWFGWQEG